MGKMNRIAVWIILVWAALALADDTVIDPLGRISERRDELQSADTILEAVPLGATDPSNISNEYELLADHLEAMMKQALEYVPTAKSGWVLNKDAREAATVAAQCGLAAATMRREAREMRWGMLYNDP